MSWNAPVDLEWIEQEADFDEDNTRTIDDVREANDIMRKVAFLRAKKAEHQASRDAEVREWDAWLAREHKRLDGPLNYFEGLLIEHQRRRLEDGGPKTLDLPSGRVKSRTTSDALTVADPQAFADWCHDNGCDDLVQWTPRVKVSDAKKVAVAAGESAVNPETGEKVPGLSVREGSTTFTVDPDGGAA